MCSTLRSTATGYCKSGIQPGIASVCVHRGEEPPVDGCNGIVNVFFSHCNLQCEFCQNKQISNNNTFVHHHQSLSESISSITDLFEKHRISSVGFVSPSHHIREVIAIVEELRLRGWNPTVVYNTNSYDTVDSLRLLESFVDVYLPDFKYSDEQIAKELSGVSDYPLVALRAIKEMYRQKGNQLLINEQGYAEKGLIIRHLVLPGYSQNSKNVLSLIADEISMNVHVSLMSQYNPQYYTGNTKCLTGRLSVDEYQEIVNWFHGVGLHKGWIQELDSSSVYNPNFDQPHPFE